MPFQGCLPTDHACMHACMFFGPCLEEPQKHLLPFIDLIVELCSARYAAGATIQILLFGILAIEVKRKAPTAHTVLEIISESLPQSSCLPCPASALLVTWTLKGQQIVRMPYQWPHRSPHFLMRLLDTLLMCMEHNAHQRWLCRDLQMNNASVAICQGTI